MSKVLKGIVVSNKTEQTVTVKVERRYRHPVYDKIIKRDKKYLVHNPKLKLKEGDLVEIKPVRPISKNKHYLIVNKK